MQQNIPKKSSLNIKRISEQRLIDTKIIKPQGQSSVKRTVAWVAALGFLVGGGILGYFWFSSSSVERDTNPNIIVPEEVVVDESAEVLTPPAPMPQPTKKMVEVMDTETGYLNVRKGPGTNFEKIREIKPREVYEYLSEDPAGWYQIKFPDGSTGWVINKYAKVK